MSSDKFQFKIDRVRSRFSKAELIASLKEFGSLNNVQTFGMRDYNKWNKRIVTADTIRVMFGSWGKALHAAGFRAVRSGKFDPKGMVAAFKDCWQQQQSVPSRKQPEEYLTRHNLPFRLKSYEKFYGGIGRLAELVVEVQEGRLLESFL